jgi:Zn-dependent peptidase ImmA (M78 family)
MFLYSNGPSVCVNWAADEEDAYPHMPGYFVESGLVCAERDVVDVALREFVSKVLSRLQGSNAPQVKDLRQNWSAISEGDAEESAFCMASAQMGLDPYSSDTWDAALVQFLEHQVGDALEEPLTRDFLEAATAPSAVAAWRWVADTTQSLGLQRRMPSRPRPPIGLTANAATIGYSLAQRTRGMAGLSARAPVADLSSLAERLGWGSFSFEERNHLPPSSVRAAVGWRSDTEPVVAGPQPGRSDSLRFLEARGLYHVLFGCEKGPRLVTEAHTWDQQASRAFAAELLVPRDAILDRCAPDTNSQELDNILATLAGEYQVSTKVIEHQLENSGISVSI